MPTDSAATAIPPLSNRPTPIGASVPPQNDRVKFFCSHGGSILPRPGDGQLKYVGGETRVISVTRDISFEEFTKKVTYMVEGKMTIKYQLMTEDLDSLVSVKCDEDLHLMFEEIEHCQTSGSPRLRIFLFPLTRSGTESPSNSFEHYAPEQRYIDSINGRNRPAPLTLKQRPNFNNLQCSSQASSACTSPRSPDSTAAETMNSEFILPNNQRKGGLGGMQRVRSSPSIYNLSASQPSSHHQVHPHYHQNYRQPHLASYQPPKPPLDSHKSSGASDRMFSIGPSARVEAPRHHVDSHKSSGGFSVGSSARVEAPRYHVDSGSQYNNHYAFRQNRGNGFDTRSSHHDEGTHLPDGRSMDRSRSLSSGRPGAMRNWDGTMQ